MTLKEWIEKKNISYRALAYLWGMDHSKIYRYANGERVPTIANAMKIEELTDGEVTVRDFGPKILRNKNK